MHARTIEQTSPQWSHASAALKNLVIEAMTETVRQVARPWPLRAGIIGGSAVFLIGAGASAATSMDSSSMSATPYITAMGGALTLLGSGVIALVRSAVSAKIQLAKEKADKDEAEDRARIVDAEANKAIALARIETENAEHAARLARRTAEEEAAARRRALKESELLPRFNALQAKSEADAKRIADLESRVNEKDEKLDSMSEELRLFARRILESQGALRPGEMSHPTS